MSGYATGPYRRPMVEAYADAQGHTRYLIVASCTTVTHEEWADGPISAFEQWVRAHGLTGYDAFAGVPNEDGGYAFFLWSGTVKEMVLVTPHSTTQDAVKAEDD